MANFTEYWTEAHQLLDRARMLNDDANMTGLTFVNTELAVSRAFAERALAAFSAGDSDKAKQAARAATAAYRAVQRFLPKLLVQTNSERWWFGSWAPSPLSLRSFPSSNSPT